MLIQAMVAALAVGAGDFQPGDLLVTTGGFPGLDSALGQYRDGEFIQQIQGTGDYWVGAAALGDGLAAVCYADPRGNHGVNILSETGEQAHTFELTELSEFGSARDISVFADGTLAIVDSAGSVLLYQQDGTYVETFQTPSIELFCSHVDAHDRLWVVDSGAFPWQVHVIGRDGALIDTIELGFEAGDLVIDEDTFWISGYDSGLVHLMDFDGTVLDEFEAGFFDHMFGCVALGHDGTLWTANTNVKVVRQFTTDGELLQEFTAPQSGLAVAFMDVVPAGACAADCNGDGALDVLDFICFQGEWQAQTAAGDCDGDGAFSVLDFVCFQVRFQGGCG